MSLVIVGAGIMGRGIAYVAVTEAEYNVILVDAFPKALTDSLAYIDKLARKEGFDPQVVASRIVTKPSIEEAFKSTPADFVIEAVPEVIELKARVFQDLAKYASPNTVLATNTSSIPVTRIANVIGSKQRVIGMHFFNPVPVMPGLEVIRTEYTEQSVVDRTVKLGEKLGKQVTVLQKDIAGFIVNRVLMATMLESTRLLERGAGSIEEIDRIMKYAAGMPMGPFRLADLVGLDTVNSLMQIIHEDSGKDRRYTPSPTIQKLVSEGKLGNKTGEGFYVYKQKSKL